MGAIMLLKKKVSNFITDDINVSSDGSDRENYDYHDEENSTE